mgnify:CR=1 FL=1
MEDIRDMSVNSGKMKIVINKQGTVYKYDKNKYKAFKVRYDNDPIYKSKHLAKAKEKINCKLCNKIITRSNMSRHRRGERCKLLSYKFNFHRVLKDLVKV